VILYNKIECTKDFIQFRGRVRQEFALVCVFENEIDEFSDGEEIAEQGQAYSSAEVLRRVAEQPISVEMPIECYPYTHGTGTIIDFLNCTSIFSRFINAVTPQGHKSVFSLYSHMNTDPTVCVPTPTGYKRYPLSSIREKENFDELHLVLINVLSKGKSGGKSLFTKKGTLKMLHFFICREFAERKWILDNNRACPKAVIMTRRNCDWEQIDTCRAALSKKFDNTHIEKFSKA